MIIDIRDSRQGRERYSVNNNEKKHGLYRYWSSNGNLWFEINYKDEKYHGSYRHWLSTGELWCEIIHKN